MGRTNTDTKIKLIETATELIWQNSYNSVSVDGICKKADVKKGSFYHYFPAKSDLALATMDWCMENTKTHYDDMFSPTRPPEERFQLMVDHIIEQQEEKLQHLGHVCGCPFATLGSELAAQDSSFGKKISEICEKKTAYYESALRDLQTIDAIDENVNIQLKAQDIFAFIVGQLIMARIRNDLKPLKTQLGPALFALIGIHKTTPTPHKKI